MVRRKGGPMLSTIDEKMYWKQEIKNKVVFSELRMFDLFRRTLGGMNL